MHDLFENDVRFVNRIAAEEWRHRPMRDRIVQAVVARCRCLL
jgi:hypothetical protein